MTDHLQLLFDKVSKHLLAQNEKALLPHYEVASTETTPCRYRGTGGTSCAVGCLIDDEFYSEELEGYCISDESAVVYAVESSQGFDLTNRDIQLLTRLQNIHDRDQPDNWRILLKDLAANVGLTFNG